VGVDRARFRDKALEFLRAHENDAVLFKVRHGKQLTATDLEDSSGSWLRAASTRTALADAAASAQSLGLFVRSLVGLDKAAATEELSAFTSDTTLTGNQLTFVNLLVEQLTRQGAVDPALLYEAPFTGLALTGPDRLFTGAQVTSLVEVLRHIRSTAEAS
jgi:type I restriction enzyme R subunit